MSFTNHGWQEWVATYKRWMCVYKSPVIDATIDLEWQPAFRQKGFTVEELNNAVYWLFEDPERASDMRTHYGHICGWIARDRASRARGKAAMEKRLADAAHDLEVLTDRKAKGLEIDPEAYRRLLRIVGRPEDASMPKEQS